MPGEVWKDVPGFEGSYHASSMGRVKSLDRTILHPRLKTQFVRGRILSQPVHRNGNIVTGEPMVDLQVTLTVENRVHYFNTGRLIYLTFIDPRLDYSRDGMYVASADGNGYDNRPENLVLMTNSGKQKRAHARGRLYPFLKTADRSGWHNPTNSRPMEQYDLEGRLLATYASVREAARLGGCDEARREVIVRNYN